MRLDSGPPARLIAALLAVLAALSLCSCASSISRPLTGAATLLTARDGAGSMAASTGAPALHAGERWRYRRVDLWRNEVIEEFEQELLSQRDARWLVEWRIGESEDPLRRNSVSSESMRAEDHGFADPKLKGRHVPLAFPLYSGKQWSFRYHFETQQLLDVAVDQTARVEGWEEIEVPAGRFRTIKVSHSGRYRAIEPGAYAWTGSISETYWYAPEARRIVQREYRDTKGDGTPYEQFRDELVSMRLVSVGGAAMATTDRRGNVSNKPLQ